MLCFMFTVVFSRSSPGGPLLADKTVPQGPLMADIYYNKSHFAKSGDGCTVRKTCMRGMFHKTSVSCHVFPIRWL